MRLKTTYLLAAIVTIIDSVLDQVKVHLSGDDATIIWGHFGRDSFQEALNVLFLLLNEVFKRVEKLALFFTDEHVHRFCDGLDLICASILDVPEADPLVVIHLLLICSLAIDSGAGTT